MAKVTRNLMDHFYGGFVPALGLQGAITASLTSIAYNFGLQADWKILAGAAAVALPTAIGAYHTGSMGSAFLRTQDTPERHAVRQLYLAHNKEKRLQKLKNSMNDFKWGRSP